MSLVQIFRHRTCRLHFIVVIALMLGLNLSLFVIQHYQSQAQAAALLRYAKSSSSLDILPAKSWLNADSGFVLQSQAAQADYFPLHVDNAVIYIDKTLLGQPAIWLHIVVNLLFLTILLSVFLAWTNKVVTYDGFRVSVLKAVKALELKLDLSVETDQEPDRRLNKVALSLDQMLRRDREIRHLVKVQGLIDHELAIGNRVFFESKLQHYLNDNSEADVGALFIIQLVGVNDGSGAGQFIRRLKACVDILQGIAADYADTVLARLAASDLVLLVAGLNGKDIERLGDTIARLLSKASCFADIQEQDLVHIGYASYQRGHTSYQVLSDADMALRTAQLHGPNAAYGFVQHNRPQAKGSVWWRSELTNALREQRLNLSFQPVFSWQDRDVLQHEVFIRLKGSDGRSIPAAVFLPMAYNLGFAAEIDQYVLLKTARFCAVDSKTFNRCSVNISVQSLLDKEWWQWLEHMLLSGQIEPQQIAVEVSEHYLLRHYKVLKAKLLKLYQAGFTLVVDQVGLVIDNTAYADELPLESVKLHPSVVRNIDQHLEQQLFVRGLIAGFSGKGVRVIATGVELEAEWQALQKAGIAGGQGFYFSQPLNQIIAQSHSQ